MNTKTLTILTAAATAVLALPTAARASDVSVSLSADLPEIEASFDELDVCAFVDDFIDKLGVVGAFLPRLCDYEVEGKFGVGVAKFSLKGSLQQLVVQDAYVAVEGGFDATVEVSPMRIEGGRAPVFAPCDRGDFLGCVSLPSGDSLEAWINEFVPMLSVDLPAPNRMCVPGLPVMVKNGYWIAGRWTAGYWSGWTYHAPRWTPPRWVAPKFEQCRISDWGELPSVTLPEVQRVVLDAYPHVTADMGVSVSANGKATVEIPIPYTGISAAYGTGRIGVELSGGVFLVASIEAKDAGFDAHLSLDEYVHLHMVYERGIGWTQTGEVYQHEIAPSFDPHGDIIARVGIKFGLKAEAKAGLGGSSTDDSKKTEDKTEEPTEETTEETTSDKTDETTEDKASEGTTEEKSEKSSAEVGMDKSPLAGPVECGPAMPNTQVGLELKAYVGSYFEGAYEIGAEDPVFNIDWVTEFEHAESLSMAGVCEVSCDSVAGDDSPYCGTAELLRVNVTSL